MGKVEQVNAYRDEICRQVDKYIDKNPKNNMGQLKFLKGLLIGNVAVTIGKKIRKDKRFKDYLKKVILGDNDEVLSFIDKEKNLKELINAPCLQFPEIYQGLQPKCELPPYLLIEKARSSIENAFVDYVSRPPEDDNMGRKKDAYLNLLFGIAFYEICLIEYGGKLSEMQQSKKERPALEKEPIRKCFLEIAKEYDQLREMCMVSNYWITHVVNLYAILRVIVLIEYVKVALMKNPNDKRRGTGDISAVKEAKFWLDCAEKWKGCYLFSYIDVNRNLMVNGNKLSQIVQENLVLPHIESKQHISEFTKYFYDNDADMLKYIRAIKQHRKNPKSREAERELWDTAVNFAIPIICVVQEITKIR